MKYILVIGDGMADLPMPELSGKTVLQAARTPALDALASAGSVGLCKTVPNGVPAGSDTAILSIFGCDPRKYYTGRSPLEAAGAGVTLGPGEISMRLNLVSLKGDTFDESVMVSHSGGGVEGEETLALANALVKDAAFAELAAKANLKITPTPSFRHVAVMDGAPGDYGLTPPHDILEKPVAPHLPKGESTERLTALMRASWRALDGHPVNKARRARGELPANAAWFWGAGTATELPSFKQRYGTGGAVATAVPLVRGIAFLCGLDAPEIPGANGDIDTNYEGKIEAALIGLRFGDFAAIHLEAPDERGHAGDLPGKIAAIEALDARLIAPLMEALRRDFPDHRVLVMPDHPTPLATRTHSADPVPFLLYDSRENLCTGRRLTEADAAAGPLVDPGTRVMDLLFGRG